MYGTIALLGSSLLTINAAKDMQVGVENPGLGLALVALWTLED